MDEKMRTIGYLCPACRKQVIRDRSAFALAASGAVVACECGKSSLTIDAEERRFRLSVPCGLCGGTHTALCPPERLLHGDTALTCPASGDFDCFIGAEGTVEDHLRELSILAEKRKGDSGDAAFLDSVIMYETLSELRDIAARKDGITCRCGSRAYRIQVRHAAIDLLCAQCGGRLRIPAATDEDLDRLCCHMALVIPGEAK